MKTEPDFTIGTLQKDLAVLRRAIERRDLANRDHVAFQRKLVDELAAEREKVEDQDQLWRGRYNDCYLQLLQAEAAIAEHNDKTRPGDCYHIDVDLSALEKHDAEVFEKGYNEGCDDSMVTVAEVRKPLIDALKTLANDKSLGSARGVARNALQSLCEN